MLFLFYYCLKFLIHIVLKFRNMQKSMRTNLILFIFLFISFAGKSVPLSNQAELSLLTCSPGNEAYSVYGHTALRVRDELYKYDVVFNYGLFNFDTPNFVYRFARGETDYLLGAYEFSIFYDEYVVEKRSIYEQVLNLNQEEKQKIFEYLLWNARPENRIYRYNFFFDNCATRIRDVVAQNTQGTVVFPDMPETPKTFRQLIKEYHSKLIWLNFGIDLVISAPADRIATVSEEMFLPDYLMKYFAEASVISNEGTKPLVKQSRIIFQAPELSIKNMKATGPSVVFGLLALMALLISIQQFRKGKITAWPDYFVYGLTGIMGIVMLWLAIFSEHPAMRPNYNLLWAIPLNLVFAVVWMVKKWRDKIKYYHLIISCWLVLVVFVEFFLPQVFNPIHYFFILMVLSRSVTHFFFILKRQDKTFSTKK